MNETVSPTQEIGILLLCHTNVILSLPYEMSSLVMAYGWDVKSYLWHIISLWYVTNPCYNLNTQTMYLVSVPFLLGGGGGGGGGCYKSMLQPQYTNCVSCISAFFVGGGGGGGGLLQIHVTTSIHKLCILYQCPFGGPKLVHICAFEWYTKTTSAGTLTHWGRDKTAAILHFIRWKLSYFD